MNSRYTLALALLFSGIPAFTITNERALGLGDIEAAVVWLASEKLPDWKCPFPLKEAIQREVIINRADAHITQGSLNLDVELPSAGSVSIVNNDEALHVLYVVAKDLLDRKTTGQLAADASKTYVIEKIANAGLWLVSQLNVEQLLPDNITNGTLYNFFRKELARFGVAHAIQKVCNK